VWPIYGSSDPDWPIPELLLQQVAFVAFPPPNGAVVLLPLGCVSPLPRGVAPQGVAAAPVHLFCGALLVLVVGARIPVPLWRSFQSDACSEKSRHRIESGMLRRAFPARLAPFPARLRPGSHERRLAAWSYLWPPSPTIECPFRPGS